MLSSGCLWDSQMAMWSGASRGCLSETGFPVPQCSCSGLEHQSRYDDPRRRVACLLYLSYKIKSFLTSYFETTTDSKEAGKIVQRSLWYPLCSFSQWLDFT